MIPTEKRPGIWRFQGKYLEFTRWGKGTYEHRKRGGLVQWGKPPLSCDFYFYFCYPSSVNHWRLRGVRWTSPCQEPQQHLRLRGRLHHPGPRLRQSRPRRKTQRAEPAVLRPRARGRDVCRETICVFLFLFFGRNGVWSPFFRVFLALFPAFSAFSPKLAGGFLLTVFVSCFLTQSFGSLRPGLDPFDPSGQARTLKGRIRCEWPPRCRGTLGVGCAWSRTRPDAARRASRQRAWRFDTFTRKRGERVELGGGVVALSFCWAEVLATCQFSFLVHGRDHRFISRSELGK